MESMYDVLFKCLSTILLAVVTYVIVPAITEFRATKLDEHQRQQLTFWVETGVLWAKQWMQSATGEEKKAAVIEFVWQKVVDLKLPYTKEDVDKSIEAIYNTVKDVTDAAAGSTVAESCGGENDVA